MTVKELIDALSKCDENYQVVYGLLPWALDPVLDTYIDAEEKKVTLVPIELPYKPAEVFSKPNVTYGAKIDYNWS